MTEVPVIWIPQDFEHYFASWRRMIGLFCNDVLSYLWPLGAAASALPLAISLSLSLSLSLSSPSLLSLPLLPLTLSLPSLSLPSPAPHVYICGMLEICQLCSTFNFEAMSSLSLAPATLFSLHSLVIYQDVAFFTSDEGPLYYHAAGATKK